MLDSYFQAVTGEGMPKVGQRPERFFEPDGMTSKS